MGAILVQTFTEEFIFRGFVTQGILLVLRRPLPAACVSGLVFGAMHIPNGWPQAINAVWFGIICALIAIRTGGIALTSGIHLANNYFGAMGVVSGGDVFKGQPRSFRPEHAAAAMVGSRPGRSGVGDSALAVATA